MGYSKFKEHSVNGRYVTLENLQETWLNSLPSTLISEVGKSVEGRPIYSIQIGKGTKKILMWSQMHGNESTTTKAVLDLMNFLKDEKASKLLREECTLLIIPILNPDGAKAYTRVNANQIDLNRDAKNLTQPESVALRQVFEAFSPDYCLNLHDQRTLFSAGNTDKPASVSFLSPAANAEREITPSREMAMRLIVAMNTILQQKIPNRVGRYDDSFNDNCVGDAFQMRGVPTILFEAGHSPKDYNREKTREYIFIALMECLKSIASDTILEYDVEDYFTIPENKKLFYDILVENPRVLNLNLNDKDKIGIRYKEVLNENTVEFIPEIIEIGSLEGYYGHEEYDCIDSEQLKTLSAMKEVLKLIQEAK
ncbi:M14 family metallopeptidase [Flagellimonas nanhaiensis]|uniref:DUF2817 domain-containing protein n=1 Tax=Flagellimonas nanhaiensis TaxID=2292706 RepID=A0A371JV10_9FLAO|nr:M14 metallopeptidase family protein [Allomuricauda nanhaiensis]RDY61648.1 DUF2817 domain-containing protein [Allomuricauda nanhaiensis]